MRWGQYSQRMSEIRVDVSADAALIIFELLHRWEDAGAPRPALDLAEWKAFSELSASLERSLPEPFLPDYRELVDGARARITEHASHD
jgi:hypothetical protein